MASSQHYNPYAPRRASSSYATRATPGRGPPPQTVPATSPYAIYNNPAWNQEYNSRARTRDMNEQAQDESAALAMQEELDIAQAIANSTHTAEKEARRRRRERDLSDKRPPSHYMQPLRPVPSNSSASSARQRPAPEEPTIQTNASFRARRYIRHPNASPAEKLFEHDTMFTADFRCPLCDQLIEISQLRKQRYSSAVISLLHLRCSRCSTVYCRGCALRANCPERCTGGQHCPLVKHSCQPMNAVAIFEALSDLDMAYATGAATLASCSPPSRSQREDYLEFIISRADVKSSNTFDGVLLYALSEINFWLSEKREVGDADPSVALLLASSYIFEIVQHYLSQPNAGDWVIRDDIYLQLLILMTTLAARSGLYHLVMEPRRIKHMCGLPNIIWAQGKILWEEGPDALSPPLFTIITEMNDCSRALQKLQGGLKSTELKQKAWSLQRQIHDIRLTASLRS